MQQDILDEANDQAVEQSQTDQAEQQSDELPDDIEELKKGYMRQADYTRKTQQLARERKELERWKTLIENFEKQGITPETATQPAVPPDAPEELVRNLSEMGLPPETAAHPRVKQAWEALQKANYESERALAVANLSIAAELAAVQAALSYQQMQQFDAKIEEDIARLKQDPSLSAFLEDEANVNAVRGLVHSNGLTAEQATWALFGSEIVKANSESAFLEGRTRREKASAVSIPASTASTANVDTGGSPPREVIERAAREGSSRAILDWFSTHVAGRRR